MLDSRDTEVYLITDFYNGIKLWFSYMKLKSNIYKRKDKMLRTEYKNNILTAYIDGEIDHDSAAKIRSRIDGAAQSLKPKLLNLDFSAVSFMDSSGVGLVMGRYRQMKLIGGALRVVNVPDRLYRIFAMSGLEALGVLR